MLDIFDDGVATMVEFGKNDMMPHFIYCYGDYWLSHKKLKEIILKKMRKYGIQSSVLTTLVMRREYLITKEKSKQAAEGKLKNEPDWEYYEGSINDDLDSFVNNLHNSEKIDNEYVSSFLLPKLTKEELKLVEQKNNEHMKSYLFTDPDVDVEEMKKSDSKDKYLHSSCRRITVYLSRESDQNSSKNVPPSTEWAAGWEAGWAAAMRDGMGRQSDDQSDDRSNDSRSPIRKRIRK